MTSVKRWTAAVVLLCVTVAFPVSAQDDTLTFPEPTGSPVGYRLVTATDADREEVFTAAEGDVRSFPLAIYYPAAPADDASPSSYTTEAERAAYASTIYLPESTFEAIESQVYADAPLVPQEGGYPVLLFSPGFGSPIRLYTALLTEIASQGYIVVAVDHPYSLAASIYPDDSVVTANAAGMDLATAETRDGVLAVWIDDTRHALDYLAELNTSDAVLAGAFDLTRVGAFGHSFGGATAANIARMDVGVGAALNMDGTIYGDAGEGVPTPFMMMQAEAYEVSDADLAAVGMSRDDYNAVMADYNGTIAGALAASEAPYRIAIDGVLHGTFATDVALYQALMPTVIVPELIGTIGGERATQVMADYTVAFFDSALLGEASPLLDGPSADYPEVEFVTP